MCDLFVLNSGATDVYFASTDVYFAATDVYFASTVLPNRRWTTLLTKRNKEEVHQSRISLLEKAHKCFKEHQQWK